MRSHTNQWKATPSHRNPHLFMDAGKHMQCFTGGSQSFSYGLSRTSVGVVRIRKGLKEMKNQCHELSSTLLICLASSGIHLTGGDLLDNHSAVSISLKNLKQTRDRRCIFGRVQRWLGSTGKTAKAQLYWLFCSTTDIIAVPSCTTTNEWTIWSGRGDVL